MGTQSEQLERKAHQVRTRLTETLEELRAGMTPGQVVDQLADYARESPAAEFFANLAREIRQNPLPAHADWSRPRLVDNSEQSIVTRSRQALYSKGGR
jgi:Protein of unknown function (DUF3618)